MDGLYNTNVEESSSSKKEIKINLGVIYVFLLVISVAVIYFYSVYQDDYLKIIIPYTILWPISIMVIGISIFRVKNTAAFSIGFFITTMSVGLTLTYIFVYSNNVKEYKNTIILPTKDISAINTNINLVDTDTTIRVEDKKFFKADLNSNYDSGNYSDSIDNGINNIKLEQSLFPQGLGSYDKLANITFPGKIPISFDLKLNLSSANIDLSKIKFLGATMDIKNSKVDIIAKDLDIEKDTTVNIKSFFSEINFLISGDIDIVLLDLSTLSQNQFIGLEKDSANVNLYKVEGSDSKKTLIINIASTISKINIKYE